MTVHFIGAGPGAADLITLRGRDLIAASPVCLYAGSLVPQALQQSGLAGAAFVPLDAPTLPYETQCLWKTARDHTALGAFLGAVRAAAEPLQS